MSGNESSGQNGRNFQKIMDDIRQSSFQFQQPADLIILLGYSVNLYAAIRICVEAGVFRILAASSGPVAASDLAKKLNGVPESDTEENVADREEFITRMCRAICALNLADEAGPAVYQANELTRTLADPGFDLGIQELFDTALHPHSTLSHMTFWARDHKYKAPERATDGPFQQARGIVGTTTFDHFVKSEPHLLSNLSALMKVIQRDRLNWSAWFPADVLFQEGSESDDAFMVDVGGGLGHDLMGLAGRYPEKKIRLVVEDMPSVIEETRAEKLDPRIELVEHDFFQQQPVKGAKIVSWNNVGATGPRLIDLAVLHAQNHARLARLRMRPDSDASPRCNVTGLSHLHQ